MILEELLCDQLAGDERIREKLAVYNGKPAVFYGGAPEKADAGWETDNHYPNIQFLVHRQEDKERKTDGLIPINIFCNKAGMQAEEIKPYIRNCLKDLFLKPEGKSYYRFREGVVAVFDFPIDLKRTEITFDLLEFQSQRMTDPDIVAVLSQYINEQLPECIILGIDNTGEILESTLDTPVVYCRMETMAKSSETNAVVWMDSKIGVYCMNPSSEIRLIMTTFLANQLSLDGEILMPDGSPMMISDVQINNRADYLTEGQLAITVHYGLLRNRQAVQSINEINFNLT